VYIFYFPYLTYSIHKSCAGFVSPQIVALPPTAVAGFTSDQIGFIPPDALSNITALQIISLTPSACSGFTAHHIDHLPPCAILPIYIILFLYYYTSRSSFVGWTAAQVPYWTTTLFGACAGLKASSLSNIKPDTFSGLTRECVIDIPATSWTGISLDAQISSLSLEATGGFTSDALSHLNPIGVSGLSSDQVILHDFGHLNLILTIEIDR